LSKTAPLRRLLARFLGTAPANPLPVTTPTAGAFIPSPAETHTKTCLPRLGIPSLRTDKISRFFVIQTTRGSTSLIINEPARPSAGPSPWPFSASGPCDRPWSASSCGSRVLSFVFLLLADKFFSLAFLVDSSAGFISRLNYTLLPIVVKEERPPACAWKSCFRGFRGRAPGNAPEASGLRLPVSVVSGCVRSGFMRPIYKFYQLDPLNVLRSLKGPCYNPPASPRSATWAFCAFRAFFHKCGKDG
jgi:hypothetical protein